MIDVPASINWYLTKRCNLVCTHCYNYESDELPSVGRRELSREETLRVADGLVESGVFMVNLIGGEPLTVKWAVDLVRRLAQGGVKVAIATNGVLLDEEKARALIEAGAHRFQISLDGASAAVHDAVRGKGSFDKALRALRILRDLGHSPQVGFTVMKKNQHELRDVIVLMKRERIRLLKLNAMIPAGRAEEDRAEMPDKVLFARQVEWLLGQERLARGQLVVDYPCFVGHVGEGAALAWKPERRAVHLSCGAGTTRAVIWEDGTVGACDFMRDDHVGDVRHERIEVIWTRGDEAIERWRRLDLVDDKCGSCGYQEKCGFGCRANAYFAGGDFYGWDPMCISEPPKGIEHPWEALRETSQRARPRQRRHLHVLKPARGLSA